MSANAKRILGDIVEQQRQESMPELSIQDYFEIFSAEQIAKDFTPTFEELEAAIVDGEHDGGIDSIFVLINGDIAREDTDLSVFKKNIAISLTIIQSKTSGGFSEDPVNRLISSLPKLLDLTSDFSQLTQYNDQVRAALDVFRKTYRTLAARFPRLEISIHYAAMNADSEISPNLQKKVDDLISIVQSMFDEASVSFNFYGARELLALARQQPNQTFDLRFAKALPAENGYVLLSKLKDFNAFLRNDGSAVRHDLFESNVRDYPGTTEVNEDISSALRGSKDIDFWWLNNGVTVLASKAHIVGNSIKIENPQIVNGLQTSTRIAKYFEEGGEDEDRVVMVKIISSEDEAVRDQIIKATNSQNVVPRASLRATDKIQRDIEHVLKMGGYYYDRRKNFYKNQGRPAAKIVSIPLLAQAMMTLLLGEPDNARARPSSLIKEDGVYGGLFSEDHPVDAYYVAADLIKRTELALKAREKLSARDVNNLRFYCLYWIAGWACKAVTIKAPKIASIKGGVTSSDIEAGIDLVSDMFFAEGRTDQIAKGPDFKVKLRDKLSEYVKQHYLDKAITSK